MIALKKYRLINKSKKKYFKLYQIIGTANILIAISVFILKYKMNVSYFILAFLCEIILMNVNKISINLIIRSTLYIVKVYITNV